MKVIVRFFAALLAIAALYLIIVGGKLIGLGGSPYYCLVGAAYLIAAWLAWRLDGRAVYVAGGAFLLTLLWAFWEVGFNYWALFPRLLVPLAILWVAFFLFSSGKAKHGRRNMVLGFVTLAGVAVFFGRGFMNVPVVEGNDAVPYRLAAANNTPVNWTAYSRDTMGTRYSPFTQINRDNVKHLQLAWTYRTGRRTDDDNLVDQNTPLQIGNTLYLCTPQNAIHAIDATTGKRKWMWDPKASAYAWARCRGLGYYEDAPAATALPGAPTPAVAPLPAAAKPCARRIIGNTIDGRLFALDSETGAPCANFGTGGIVNLRDKMGAEGPGYYYQTSAPLVAGNKIIVGGWVSDNQMLGEPSGAIRAFDVHSGALVWAWDPANPAVTKDPVDGDSYTVGTPNMWTHAAYDPALGLVYAPMGNAGTDYYNAARPELSRKYNAAIVALDVNTGRPRWSFQTTHNDLWDYDIPSQPALLDMKNDQGQMVPAILVFTKRGQIFALDRRTGAPISRIVERPVPTKGSVPENIVSPTQPYSVDMPVMSADPLTEASSWGMTMFDQLLCRISFRQMRYEGDFTPPGLDWSIATPSAIGGQNWGSASYDPVNHRLFVNDTRQANTHKMMPRAEYLEFAKTHPATPNGHGVAPMDGTPYGETTENWMSALGVPCQTPPYGTVTAIDLDTKKIAWQVPAGTAKMLGPLGMRLGLPMTPGMPTYAGTSTTAGGLTFFAGTQDYYLRAYDGQTGKEVWKYALPVGASATPMSYISPTDGRQYIVLSVGGAAHSKDVGDYVMAFALPKKA
nr:membrane-bound PQQ-dependent dehydrogenase, glucose/quinate/shikimate family [uncultured Sphingomonas sp.]